jgi:hypothetical protein
MAWTEAEEPPKRAKPPAQHRWAELPNDEKRQFVESVTQSIIHGKIEQ